ncbi:MAG: hypothetical protein GQ564_09375 [Bacteroidales bacterium]|nr:hypothetical protein [Bacteroidales bacterium]
MKKLGILAVLTLILTGFVYCNNGTDEGKANQSVNEKEVGRSVVSPSNVDAVWQFAMTPIDDSEWAAGLNGKNGLTRVSLRDIKLNREGGSVSSFPSDYKFSNQDVKAFKWRQSDNETNAWRPQGIAGIRLENPQYSMVAVTWYNYDGSGKKGVRISFVDVTPGSDKRFHYRHVLLVERDGDDFKPVDNGLHAGGLAYSKGFLFVPDTHNGIRVFDTRNIYMGVEKDDTKKKYGFKGEKAYAFDYTYILPQVYNYSTLYSTLITTGMAKASGNQPKFSYLSIDWSDNNERKLLTGSYMSNGNMDNGLSPSMFLWKLSTEPGKLVPEKPRNLGIECGLERYRWIQGAALFGSTLYISRSNGEGVRKHSVSGNWSSDNYSVDKVQTRVLPIVKEKSDIGFEDLHISLSSDILWGLSEGSRTGKPEFTGDRIVFWIKKVK